MTDGVLPHRVEMRALAARTTDLVGHLDPAKLTRLQAAGASGQSPVAVKARFFRDEEGRYVLELAVEARVAVTCQRCLGELEESLQSQTQLVALWSDADAGQLPARYDPLVVGEELDLWQAVEDELLLALPNYSYHSDIECGSQSGVVVEPYDDNGIDGDDNGQQRSPFDVLITLKHYS